MRSSYESQNYQKIFQLISFISQPRVVVEFGILDGYSTDGLIAGSPNSEFYLYDIFEEFPGNHAVKSTLDEKYKSLNNVHVKKLDFFEADQLFDYRSIDVLHVDIGNYLEVWEVVEKKWFEKVNSFILLEGGSIERDRVWWMEKYRKSPFSQKAKEYIQRGVGTLMSDFPSLTVIDMRKIHVE